MARVVVSYSDFHTGRLPHVCCVTGEPTDRFVRWRFVQVPSWTWILFFVGILPWLIARAFSTENFYGTIPIVERAHARIRRLSRGMIVFGALTVGFVILIFVTTAVVFGIAAGICALAWVLTVGLLSWLTPDARHEAHEVVVMRNVRPEFVRAVEALRRGS